MKLGLRNYKLITGVCLCITVTSAYLFDKTQGTWQLMIGFIGLVAALLSVATHFYNLGFFKMRAETNHINFRDLE